MHEHSDYLRDQLCELAKVCEEIADDMDDRRVSG
jgi:hypothetical protein